MSIDLRTIALMHGFKSPQPFSREGWIFELKWDGYRVLASKRQLLTRNKKDATDWYPEITTPLATLKGEFVLDGEVCLLDERGLPRFEDMRNRTLRKGGGLVTYFAFDLLFLNGTDLRELPLLKRKQQLRKLIPENANRLIYVDHIVSEGELVFKHAVKAGMEDAVEQHKSVRIAVRDYGPGISAEFQRQIFGKFLQGDATDSRQKGGSGLGPAISRR